MFSSLLNLSNVLLFVTAGVFVFLTIAAWRRSKANHNREGGSQIEASQPVSSLQSENTKMLLRTQDPVQTISVFVDDKSSN